jgi:hypothetical protein
MNVLAYLVEAFSASKVPPDHVVFSIAKNYKIPVQVARSRWAYSKKEAFRRTAPGDLFGALYIVHSLRTEKERPAKPGALVIPRRSMKQVRSPSSMPIAPKRVHSSINITRRPKKRRLIMDMEHIRDRLERKRHKLTFSEKMKRRIARRRWALKNRSALDRRQDFLKTLRHGHH